jgi:ABC-type Fe3+ transport system permease subunit
MRSRPLLLILICLVEIMPGELRASPRPAEPEFPTHARQLGVALLGGAVAAYAGVFLTVAGQYAVHMLRYGRPLTRISSGVWVMPAVVLGAGVAALSYQNQRQRYQEQRARELEEPGFDDLRNRPGN